MSEYARARAQAFARAAKADLEAFAPSEERETLSWSRTSWWIAIGERRDAPPTRVAGIITLTTDFGLRDAYVAEMKGVMLCIAHTARRPCAVDITHDIEPHDITEGALALEAAAPFFPSGTVHLAVVDPGVGTARRGSPLIAGDQVFVGPDNGLFTPFLEGNDWRAFELDGAGLPAAAAVSRTFHGRDVFAPAAPTWRSASTPDGWGRRSPTRCVWPGPRCAR